MTIPDHQASNQALEAPARNDRDQGLRPSATGACTRRIAVVPGTRSSRGPHGIGRRRTSRRRTRDRRVWVRRSRDTWAPYRLPFEGGPLYGWSLSESSSSGGVDPRYPAPVSRRGSSPEGLLRLANRVAPYHLFERGRKRPVSPPLLEVGAVFRLGDPALAERADVVLTKYVGTRQRPIDPFGRVRGVNHLANLQPDSRSGGLHRRIFRPAFNPFRDILFNPRNHIRRDAMVLRELTSPLQTPDGRP